MWGPLCNPHWDFSMFVERERVLCVYLYTCVLWAAARHLYSTRPFSLLRAYSKSTLFFCRHNLLTSFILCRPAEFRISLFPGGAVGSHRSTSSHVIIIYYTQICCISLSSRANGCKETMKWEGREATARPRATIQQNPIYRGNEGYDT